MSKCSHCNQEGHNIRTCPLRGVETGPWFQDPEDRQHTKIVFEEEWPGGPVTELEVPCDSSTSPKARSTTTSVTWISASISGLGTSRLFGGFGCGQCDASAQWW